MWNSNLAKHIYKNNVEIELRFGKQRKSGFDPNLGSDNFNKLLEAFQQSNRWDSFYSSSYTEVFHDDDSRLNLTTNDAVFKRRLYTSNKILNSSFDLRLSIASATPTTSHSSHVTFQRDKKRYSFVKSFYRFDLTHIVNSNTFELEMEIADLSYARRHDYDFILSIMIDEFNSIIRLLI